MLGEGADRHQEPCPRCGNVPGRLRAGEALALRATDVAYLQIMQPARAIFDVISWTERKGA